MGCAASSPQKARSEYVLNTRPAKTMSPSKRSFRYRHNHREKISTTKSVRVPISSSALDSTINEEKDRSGLTSDKLISDSFSSSLNENKNSDGLENEAFQNEIDQQKEVFSSVSKLSENTATIASSSSTITAKNSKNAESVQARIEKFNRMDDDVAAANLMMTSSSSMNSVNGNGGGKPTPNSTSSSLSSPPTSTISSVSSTTIAAKISVPILRKNGIYQRIIDFEHQAEETERLRQTIHTPKQEFKHGTDIRLHQLERPRVFASPAIST